MKRRTFLAGMAVLPFATSSSDVLARARDCIARIDSILEQARQQRIGHWRVVFHIKGGGSPRALESFTDLSDAEQYMRALIVYWRHIHAMTPEPSVIVTLDGEFPYEELSHYTIEHDPYHEWMIDVDRQPANIDDTPTMTPAYYRNFAAEARQRAGVRGHATALDRWRIASGEAFAIAMERVARGGTTLDHEEARFNLRHQELAEHFGICPWDGQYTVHGFRHEYWKKMSWLS